MTAPSTRATTLAEAAEIDAELYELRSFVLFETKHAPTIRAVDVLRRKVAAALGHPDLWCVSHCTAAESDPDCICPCHLPTPGGTQ